MAQDTWFWEIRLIGEAHDLAHVAARLQRPGFTLREDAQGWWLRTDRADACEDARDAFEAVRLEASELSGVLKLATGSTVPLAPGGVIKVLAGGQRHFFLIAEAGAFRMRGRLSDDGGVRLRELAQRDAAVAKALRLLCVDDSEYWTGLYRLFEVIEADVGGSDQLVKMGGTTKPEYRRFKHSANSVAVGGDLARHGAEPQQPPSNPMTLPEAQSFANSILQHWISSKP